MIQAPTSRKRRLRLRASVCLLLLSVCPRAGAQDPVEIDPQSGQTDWETQEDVDWSDLDQPPPAFDQTSFGATPAELEAALRVELSKTDYSFCSDPEYVLHKSERPLCRYAPQMKELCPAFEGNCQRPAEQDWGNDSFLQGRLWKGKSDAPDEPPQPMTLSLPQGLAEFFRLVFFALLVLLGVGTVFWLIRNLVTWRAENKEPADLTGDGPSSEAPAAAAPRVVETDVQRLLTRAKKRAAEGNFSDASSDLHAALLRHLDHHGLLHLHSSKTNGDYVRSLRSQPEWREALRGSARVVERIQFGDYTPDRSIFSDLLARIEPLVTRAMLLLVLCIGSGWLSGCGDADNKQRPNHHWGPLTDHGAAGFSSLVHLLEQKNVEVRNHTGSIRKMDPETFKLLIHDRTALEEDDWQSLEDWVRNGHQLIIAGDRNGADHFGIHTKEAKCEGPVFFSEFYPGYRRKDDQPYSDPATLSVFASAHTLEHEFSADYSPLLSCEAGMVAISKQVGMGSVLVLADADLLSNAALASQDNALVISSLIASPDTTIEFAGGLTGAGAPSPYEALYNAKLGLVILQLALLLVVLYWSRGAAFGKLRDPVERGRRDFIDHIHALGRVLARSKGSGHALSSYSHWALERLHERIRPGARLSLIELSEAIAKRTGRKPGDVMRILAEAASSRQSDGPVSDRNPARPSGRGQEDLQTLKELESLLLETGGTR